MDLTRPACDPAPWPETGKLKPDLHLAETMLQNLAACHSETSQAALYFYAAAVTRQSAPREASVFRALCLCEARHMEIFADLSFQLGADPRLWSGPPRRLSWWTGACLCYPRGLFELLQYALYCERTELARYHTQAQHLPEPLQRVVLRAALDERCHIALLEKMLHAQE